MSNAKKRLFSSFLYEREAGTACKKGLLAAWHVFFDMCIYDACRQDAPTSKEQDGTFEVKSIQILLVQQ